MTLRAYLREAGISVADFATKRLRIQPSTLYRFFHGQPCRLDIVSKIERASSGKVSANDLLAEYRAARARARRTANPKKAAS